MYIGESFRAGRSVGQATIRTVHNTKIRVAALNSQFGAIQPTDFIVHFEHLSYKRIGRYGNGFWLLIWFIKRNITASPLHFGRPRVRSAQQCLAAPAPESRANISGEPYLYK